MKTSKEEWMKLVERYFEAETTDAEEARLRRFLVSEEAADEEFDEARAVMGLLAVGRTLHPSRQAKRRRILSPVLYRVAAVALLVLVSTATWKLADSRQNTCVAYVYGEKITDVEAVMSQMRLSLDRLDYAEEDVVESQLGDLFRTLDEEENN